MTIRSVVGPLLAVYEDEKTRIEARLTGLPLSLAVSEVCLVEAADNHLFQLLPSDELCAQGGHISRCVPKMAVLCAAPPLSHAGDQADGSVGETST